MPDIEKQINEKLNSYVNGNISLQEFHDWFIPATWDDRKFEEPVKRKIGEIQLRLAEYSNGHWSEQEIRDRFLALLPPSLNRSLSRIHTGATGEIINLRQSPYAWRNSPHAMSS